METKITGQMDGENIWREKTVAEKLAELLEAQKVQPKVEREDDEFTNSYNTSDDE